MDILREMRRRSLQLDTNDVDRLKSSGEPRRGSMALDSGQLSPTVDKKSHSGGLLHRLRVFSSSFFLLLLIVLHAFGGKKKEVVKGVCVSVHVDVKYIRSC